MLTRLCCWWRTLSTVTLTVHVWWWMAGWSWSWGTQRRPWRHSPQLSHTGLSGSAFCWPSWEPAQWGDKQSKECPAKSRRSWVKAWSATCSTLRYSCSTDRLLVTYIINSYFPGVLSDSDTYSSFYCLINRLFFYFCVLLTSPPRSVTAYGDSQLSRPRTCTLALSLSPSCLTPTLRV